MQSGMATEMSSVTNPGRSEAVRTKLRDETIVFASRWISLRTHLRGWECVYHLGQIASRYDKSVTTMRLADYVVEQRMSYEAARYALQAAVGAYVSQLRARENHRRGSGAPMKPAGIIASAHAFLLELEPPRARLSVLRGLLRDLVAAPCSPETLRRVVNMQAYRHADSSLMKEMASLHPDRRSQFARERLRIRCHPFAITAGATMKRMRERSIAEGRVGLLMRLSHEGFDNKRIAKELGVSPCTIADLQRDLSTGDANPEIERRVERLVAGCDR